MLIVLVFVMVGLTIAALATAPKIATAVQRDKEEEMIHRGVQYARAVKKYYKKFGRYPSTIEALEQTNNIRFLRKRYKDPFTQDGKWQLVRYGQVQISATGRQGGTFGGPNQPGLPNIPGVTGLVQGTQPGTSNFGGFGTTGQGATGSSGSGVTGTTGTGTGGTGTTGTTGTSSTTGTQSDRPVGGTFGTAGGGSSSTGTSAGQTLGGGAIIGVSSASERESLRVVADKNHYKDWKFIYDPTMDRGLITGPYDPKQQVMGQVPGAQQIGQPIGQPIGGQQPQTGFGQNQNVFGTPKLPPDTQAPPNR